MTFDRQKIKQVLLPLVKETLSQESVPDLRKNTLDIFNLTCECAIFNLSKDEWLRREIERQKQKTLQNKIGELHQKILGTLEGIQDLGVGNIIDLKGSLDDCNFIAEVKNKHNTTKGNHKVTIYDDLEKCLENEDPNTIGYYVEILPPNGKSYDEPFTPSDNKTKSNRPTNNRIRKIDGKTFYEKVTKNPDALEEIYNILPSIITEIINEEFDEEREITTASDPEEFAFIYKNK